MFDEEGNGLVKTDDLESLMSLIGINPTKRDLVNMAKDVDKDSKMAAFPGGCLGLLKISGPALLVSSRISCPSQFS